MCQLVLLTYFKLNFFFFFIQQFLYNLKLDTQESQIDSNIWRN